MKTEAFELTKKWGKWASDASKKVKSSKFSKAIAEIGTTIETYSETSSKSYQFRTLKWYAQALENLAMVAEKVEAFYDKFETDPDVNGQIILSSMDKHKSVFKAEIDKLSKEQKEYSAVVDKYNKPAPKFRKQLEDIDTKLNQRAIAATKLLDRLKEAQTDADELSTLQVLAKKLYEDTMSIGNTADQFKTLIVATAQDARNEVNADDRDLFWQIDNKSSRFEFIQNSIKSVKSAVDKIESAQPDASARPKSKAPQLPKKLQ